MKSDSLTWHLFRYVSSAGWSFHLGSLFTQCVLYCRHWTGPQQRKAKKRWYGPSDFKFGLKAWFCRWLTEILATLCSLSEFQLFMGKKGKVIVPISGMVCLWNERLWCYLVSGMKHYSINTSCYNHSCNDYYMNIALFNNPTPEQGEHWETGQMPYYRGRWAFGNLRRILSSGVRCSNRINSWVNSGGFVNLQL